MEYTLDEIRAARAQREGMQPSADDYSLDEIRAARAARQGMAQPQRQGSSRPKTYNPLSKIEPYLAKALAGIAEKTAEHPRISQGLETVAKYARPFNNLLSPLSDIGRGRLQGGHNALASLYNIPAGMADEYFGTNLRQPHLDLEKYTTGNKSAPLMELIGELSSGYGVGNTVYNVASKALPVVKGAGYWPKFANILRTGTIGGATGAAVGENAEGKRGVSALLGTLFGLGSGVNAARKALNPEKIAKEIWGGGQAAKKKGTELYNQFLGEAEKHGFKADVPLQNAVTESNHNWVYKNNPHLREALEKAKKPETATQLAERVSDPDLKHILTDSTPTLQRTATEWLHNPNIKNTHEFTKELGSVGWGNSSKDKDLGKVSRRARDNIIKQMNKTFKKEGVPELTGMLKKANKHHIENVLPHQNPLIEEFGAGDITAKRFIKELYTNKDFEAHLADRYPEVAQRAHLNKFIDSYLLPSLKIAGGGTLLGKGIHFGLKSSRENR
jgi:hypothetical protein